MTRNETPQEGLQKIHADLAELHDGIEELRRQRLDTSQDVYEFRLENAHGEQGHRRIADFAREHKISYRKAMVALADDVFPKAPKPSEPRRPVLTEAKLEAHVAETGLSYREAMVVLAGQGYVLESGEESSSPETVVMTEEEEREAFGYSHNEITAYAARVGLSYRDAMTELSTRPKEER